MNWSKVLQVLLAVTLAIGGATRLHAQTMPGSPHVQSCVSCHDAFGVAMKVRDLRYNCVSCHSAGSPGKRMPFSEEAMANPYGTTAGVTKVGEGSWRSHNWDSNMSNPKAGSVMPVNSNMNTPKLARYYQETVNGQTVEILTCTRCHRMHLSELPTVGGVVNKNDPSFVPYTGSLRDKNGDDQMCLNCHSPRNDKTSQVNGSHPVKINYTSAWRAKPATYPSFAKYTQSFYKKPRNKYPANRTAQLGNYYKTGGQIVCSTCHDVHYGDSDGATFDNRSTVNGSGTTPGFNTEMSHSTGMLLRTDQYGANADDINICTNCHKDSKGSLTRSHNNKTSYGGVNQNVQCVNCHEAHVAEDLTSTPNRKLVARTLQYSSAYGSRKGRTVVFINTTTAGYKDANEMGICQGCHRVPASTDINPRSNRADYPVIHDKPVAGSKDCSGCHPHSSSIGGFSFDQNGCSNCHGYPPPRIAVSLIGYPLNEATTPHLVHAGGVGLPTPDLTKYAYKCVECHYDGLTDRHMDTNPVDVFVQPGPIGTKFGGSPSYNPTARTCNNVYCHSIGAPGDVNMVPNSAQFKQTPSWENGLNALATNKCSRCHDDAASLSTGAHRRHLTLGASVGCYNCHSSTVNSTSTAITSKTLHATGNKDLSFAAPTGWSGGFTGSVMREASPKLVTCSNSCHFNPATLAYAQPKWNDANTGKCGTCHLTSNSISTFSAGTINSYAHTAHLTSVSGPQLGVTIPSCQTCHTSFTTTANHVNGVAAVGSCSPCHPSSLVPTWSNAASVTCRSCHVAAASVGTLSRISNQDAPNMSNFTTAGHGQSFNSVGSVTGPRTQKIDCDDCHNANTPHITPGVDNSRLTGAEATICANCHNQEWTGGARTIKKVTRTHMSFTDLNATDPTAACSSCHDLHGSANKRMIRSQIKFHEMSALYAISFTNPSSGFVQNVPPYRGLCQICHTKTDHFKRGVPNQATDYHGLGADRFCLECHKHEPSPTISNMAFGPDGNCSSCHGFPPAKSMNGIGVHNNYSTAKPYKYLTNGAQTSGGAHTVQGHVGKDLTLDNQVNSNCTNCHYNYTGGQHKQGGTTVTRDNVQVTIDPKFKFNIGPMPTYDKGTTTCSNVNCHYQQTPVWQ